MRHNILEQSQEVSYGYQTTNSVHKSEYSSRASICMFSIKGHTRKVTEGTIHTAQKTLHSTCTVEANDLNFNLNFNKSSQNYSAVNKSLTKPITLQEFLSESNVKIDILTVEKSPKLLITVYI